MSRIQSVMMIRNVTVVMILVAVFIFSGCNSDVSDTGQFYKPVTPLDATVKATRSKKRVLVVHSYDPEYEWVASINRGIKKVLDSAEVDVQFYYMDTLNNPSEDSKKQHGDEAMHAVRDWDPDIVITADDNAQAYFGKYLAGKDRPLVIFCGVNRNPEFYGYPAKNVTGVKEIIPFNETIELLRKIQPETENVMFLSDNSPTTTATLEYITNVNNSVEISTVREPATFEQWKEAVLWANDHVDAIVVYRYHVFKDELGKLIRSHDVMEWTISNVKIPVAGSLSFVVDDGALCGVVESGLQHGLEAAEIANALLEGADIEEYPVRLASKYSAKVNMSTARRLKIEIPETVISEVDIIVGDPTL